MIRHAGGAIATLLLIFSLNTAANGFPAPDTLVAYGPYDSPLGSFELYQPTDYPADAATYLQGLTSDVSLAIISRFGPVGASPFQLVIVKSREQLDEWVGGPLPDWIHAVAMEHPPRVVILGPSKNVSEPTGYHFEQALLHELTHVYLYRLKPGIEGDPLPGWFHEGLAVHVSGGFDRGMHRALIRGRLTGKFYTLGELERIYHTSSVLSELAYAQSVLAAQALEEFYGSEVFRSLFDEIRKKQSFQTAFALAAGENLEQFQARYQAHMYQRYNLLLVLADPSVLFILLPALVLLAYLLRTWRNRTIRARWAAEGIDPKTMLKEATPPYDHE